jgi:hypothetical protein
MFSLDRFYKIIHNNLIAHLPNAKSIYFYPFGTYDSKLMLTNSSDTSYPPITAHVNWTPESEFFHCYFFDQEPLFDQAVPFISKSRLTQKFIYKPGRTYLFANSEQSEIKNAIVKEFNFKDWYYFFHGFVALEWYRDFQYLNSTSFNRFDKVFICLNHLTTKYRSYRLHLVSNLIDQDLVKHGLVSLFHKDTWQETIEDPENLLDNRARVKIYKTLKNFPENLIVDTDTPTGALSADVNLDQLTSALFHVVTETIYFQDKLHLTEKIFKPIVSKRPFLLVAAPGNLAYLKSYGFKTFDRWIDESYDQEEDHYVRIEKITAEIARLCALDKSALEQIHLEMQEVLEYNFNHFYGDFKQIIVNELVDNFNSIIPITDATEVKQRLLR